VRSILGFVTHNWKLKLSALGLALLLWVTVTADQLSVQWLMVPVEIELRDPNFQLQDGPQPREVQVRISGPRREFWDLGLNRPQLRLVLTDVVEGTHQYSLDPQQVQIPRRVARGLTPIDVSPARVAISFERVTTATVPVRIRVATGPGEEFAFADTLVVRPTTVRVSGPSVRVGRINAVQTLPLDLSGEQGAIERSVQIDTTGLSDLRLSETEVTVVGRVERAIEQVIPAVPVQSPTGVLVVPGTVDVRVRGAESVLRGVTAATLRVVIPPESIPAEVSPGGTSAAVRVERLPAGVRAVAEPRFVTILAAPTPPPVPQVRTLPEPRLPGTVPPVRPDTVPPGPGVVDP